MSRLDDQFYEDRTLRDTARRNLIADVEQVRTSLSAQGIAARVFGRVGDGAVDVLERAKEQADDKRGVLAALIGALVVWIAREPLFELLRLTNADEIEPPDEKTSAIDVPEDDMTLGEETDD